MYISYCKDENLLLLINLDDTYNLMKKNIDESITNNEARLRLSFDVLKLTHKNLFKKKTMTHSLRLCES